MSDVRASAPQPVTVIGLGAMGHALAATWLDAGHPVTVWNRSLEKADSLVARGATRAANVADAVTAGPLVVVCVLDNTVGRGLLEAHAADLHGRTLVNLTTGTPDEARALAEWVSAQGAQYLDGVIMAMPAMMGRPEAMILYGGSATAFDTYRRTLEVVAGNAPFLGPDAGLPAVYDAGMLSLMYATLTGWLQAFALVGTAGVSAAAFLPYLQAWFTNVVAEVDPWVVAKQVDEGVYPDTDGSSLALNAAALELLVRVTEEAGVDTGLLAAISALADRRLADGDGHGGDGFTSLIEAMKPRSSSPHADV